MLVVISSDCLSRCLNLCFASYNIACIVKFTERQTLQLRRIPIPSPTGFAKVMENQEFHSSRPGKSWNLIVGPRKSQLKIKVLFDRLLQLTRQEQCKINRSNYTATAQSVRILVHQSLSLRNSFEKVQKYPKTKKVFEFF